MVTTEEIFISPQEFAKILDKMYYIPNKAVLVARIGALWINFLFIGLLLLSGFLVFSEGTSLKIYKTLPFSFLFLSSLVLAVSHFLWMRHLHMKRGKSWVDTIHHYCFDTENINKISQDGTKYIVPWKNILKVDQRNGYYLLYIDKNRAFYIPEKCFTDTKDKTQFLEFLNNAVAPVSASRIKTQAINRTSFMLFKEWLQRGAIQLLAFFALFFFTLYLYCFVIFGFVSVYYSGWYAFISFMATLLMVGLNIFFSWLRYSTKERVSFLHDYHLEFGEWGIKAISSSGQFYTTSWSEVIKVKNKGTTYWLYVSKNSAIIVAKNYFKHKTDFEAFEKLLSSKKLL